MKKDRDCNNGVAPYPIYPTYIPNMINPMMTPNMLMPNTMVQPNMGTMTSNNSNQGNTTIEQQLYSLSSQVNSLERRISNLENLIGNTNATQYNTSNYQVM